MEFNEETGQTGLIRCRAWTVITSPFTCNQPLLSRYSSLFHSFFPKPPWSPFPTFDSFPKHPIISFCTIPIQSQDALPCIPQRVPYLQAVSTLSLQGAPESLSVWLTVMGLTPSAWGWHLPGMPQEGLDWRLFPLTGLLGFPQLPLFLWVLCCVLRWAFN